MTFATTKFKATWREYQKRTLEELDRHLDDRHLHVVAAPGSGKTILGLEVMCRLGKPTVVFAPTITIRNQWVDRFITMFLPNSERNPTWISKNIRRPEFMTVTTYQAFYAACSGLEGIEEEDFLEEEPGTTHKTNPCAPMNVIALLKKQKIQTIVFDEAHHLRKEWWKALMNLQAELDAPTTVSLTATPPYDVGFSEWKNYQELCGPIDTEIPVPELVKCGDLCPHQDFVHFSLPNKYETEILRRFNDDIFTVLQSLKTDAHFLDAICTHPWVYESKNHVEAILEEPKYFSAMIIYLNAVGINIPRHVLDLLGAGRADIPELSSHWLEILLTYMLHSHAEHFPEDAEMLTALRKKLQRIGAIQNRKITLINTNKIRKLLANSLSKLDSIVDIARMESDNLGHALRMTILSDYIRKSELPANKDDLRPITKIGIVPIFEYLRRANIQNIKLGVLTGSLIIIPANARQILVSAAQHISLNTDHIHFAQLDHDEDYLRVDITGVHRQKIVYLITEVFNRGGITVLVGTQALLGEGWDAPCVNTLILASVVGSYMLSNQMRGRAIRIDPSQSDKVANIWHLAAIDIQSAAQRLRNLYSGKIRQQINDPFDELEEDLGNDLKMLRRRFRAFEGLSYDTPAIIENGINRLCLSSARWDPPGIEKLNQATLRRAKDRQEMPKLWDAALQGSSPKPIMREKIESNYAPRGFAFTDTIKFMVLNALLMGAAWAGQVFRGHMGDRSVFFLLMTGLGVAALITLPKLLKALYLLIRNGTLEKSMQQVTWVIVDTLHHMDLITTHSSNLRIHTTQNKMGIVYCRLDGATAIETRYFLDTMQEILGPTQNPRYLLVRTSYLGKFLRTDYHPVPACIGQNKNYATFFARRWERYVGSVKLVYTRNIAGRKTLLQARTQSLAASFKKKTDRISIWE